MICYALRLQDNKFLHVIKTRDDVTVTETTNPTIIWDFEIAKDLQFYAHQHTGEICSIVEFDLIEKNKSCKI